MDLFTLKMACFYFALYFCFFQASPKVYFSSLDCRILSARPFMSSGSRNLLVQGLIFLEMVVLYHWKWPRRLSRS